jgi:hypothetical protein
LNHTGASACIPSYPFLICVKILTQGQSSAFGHRKESNTDKKGIRRDVHRCRRTIRIGLRYQPDVSGRTLRQGLPVSPLLSNLLLKEFDDALAKRGIAAIRYADDIAVFGDSKRECLDALDFIQENLARLALNIPELKDGGKTILSGPSDVVGFLGVEIRRFGDVYKLCAPARKVDQIDADMAAIASVDRCVTERRNIGQLVRALDSFVIGHGASMAVLDHPDEFMSRLEAAKQKHLRSLLVSLIGQRAVQGLDDDRLSILGLQPFKY